MPVDRIGHPSAPEIASTWALQAGNQRGCEIKLQECD